MNYNQVYQDCSLLYLPQQNKYPAHKHTTLLIVQSHTRNQMNSHSPSHCKATADPFILDLHGKSQLSWKHNSRHAKMRVL